MEVVIHPDEPNLYSSHRPMPSINETGRLTSEEWDTIFDLINIEQSMIIDDGLNEDMNTIRRKLRALQEEDNALSALQELDSLDQNPSLEVV